MTMVRCNMEIPAGEFKARCLQLMDEVQETGREVVITKRGRPVAKLVPVAEPDARDVFGCMRGTVIVVGDLVAPVEDPWEADQ
jgi:prevent-host-death family protein